MRENSGMNNSKAKKTLVTAAVVISQLPFAATLFAGVYCAFDGLRSSYGLEAFEGVWAACLIVFWYAYIPGVLIMLFYILPYLVRYISYKRRRKNADSEERIDKKKQSRKEV